MHLDWRRWAVALTLSRSTNHNIFLLRHGRSLANEANLIVSQPANALSPRFGLSNTGRTQAAQAGHTLWQHSITSNVTLVTSDYSRAYETACIVRDTLVAAWKNDDDDNDTRSCTLHMDQRLRERDFGPHWELQPADSNYPLIWANDLTNTIGNTDDGVESVVSVLERSLACLREWEATTIADSNNCLVLVAHGDVLQILQTAFTHLAPHQHRSVPHLDTAVPRRLIDT